MENKNVVTHPKKVNVLQFHGQHTGVTRARLTSQDSHLTISYFRRDSARWSFNIIIILHQHPFGRQDVRASRSPWHPEGMVGELRMCVCSLIRQNGINKTPISSYGLTTDNTNKHSITILPPASANGYQTAQQQKTMTKVKRT